jgi:hypothetical protein
MGHVNEVSKDLPWRDFSRQTESCLKQDEARRPKESYGRDTLAVPGQGQENYYAST